MMNDTVIRVENLSKKYCRELKHTMLYGIQDIAKNAIGLSSHSESLRDGEFWALNDVSFEIKKGETLGIIGANGSGKTTLLKLLNGIFMPDKGRIEIKGKVGALIEVGAGFHPMLTGRENIYVNGAILGMSKKDVDKKFDEIVDFADIGEFIDSPVKHYSSGMYVRLGFAVAVHSEPDILLIDEVLAVGDATFQRKCYARLKKLKEGDTTIILVAHDMNTIQRVCQYALFLERGRLVKSGEVADVVSVYYHRIEPTFADIEPERKVGPVKITNMEVLNKDYRLANRFISGEDVVLRLYFQADEPVRNPTFSISLKSADGLVYSGCSTFYDGIDIDEINGVGYIELILKNHQLGSGRYELNVGIWDEEFFSAYDWRWNYTQLSITNEKKILGRFELPHTWKVCNEA